MKNPSNVRILFDKAVVAIEKEKYPSAIAYIKKALQIEPNFPEAKSALTFAYDKIQEMISKTLDFVSNDLQKSNKKLPDTIQEKIENLRQSTEKDIDIYKWFRDWQSGAKNMSERDPNNIIKKKISNINLNNIEVSLEFLKDLKDKYPDDKELASFYKFCDLLVENGVLTYVPYLIQKKIKQTILKFSKKYERIQIVEIAEKCEEPDDVIIIIVENMIEAGEIYAEYFRSTNTVLFDKQKSITEMDK